MNVTHVDAMFGEFVRFGVHAAEVDVKVYDTQKPHKRRAKRSETRNISPAFALRKQKLIPLKSRSILTSALAMATDFAIFGSPPTRDDPCLLLSMGTSSWRTGHSDLVDGVV